jgi:hypothetical protein
MRYGHINDSIMVLGVSDHVPPVDPGETLGFPVYILLDFHQHWCGFYHGFYDGFYHGFHPIQCGEPINTIEPIEP